MAERLVITVICDDPETVAVYRDVHPDILADDLLRAQWRAIASVEEVKAVPVADTQEGA